MLILKIFILHDEILEDSRVKSRILINIKASPYVSGIERDKSVVFALFGLVWTF